VKLTPKFKDNHHGKKRCSCGKVATQTVRHPDAGIGLGGEMQTVDVCEECSDSLFEDEGVDEYMMWKSFE